MPTADEARIRELKRYGVTVFHKEVDGDSGWWWRRDDGRLNGPFPSAAAACTDDAFATVG